MSEAYPPFKTPPWARPVQSPSVQVITEDGGAINLTEDTTYLDATVSDEVYEDAETEPVAVTIPDGNHRRQTKRIYILSDNQNTTAKFRVAGSIMGATALLFNRVGWSAVLEWVDGAWHQVGGNCERE